MPVISGKQLCPQGLRIGEISVVHQDDAKRRIHIEGLRLFFAERIAGRGITHLTQTCIAWQCPHVAGAEHVTHHALGLVHEKFTPLLRDDTRCILTAVLQQKQRVIDQLVDRRRTDDANNSTHILFVIRFSEINTQFKFFIFIFRSHIISI